jgi:CPA1 family monovalent cation:H+ antiporter
MNPVRATSRARRPAPDARAPPPRTGGGSELLALELLVALGVAILVSELVAGRLRVALPVPLLACGVLLGFIPALRAVDLPPEAVLVLFLPALLYWDALTTSLREVRRDLRGIILLSTLLVVASAAAVAGTAHALGVPWGPAWVLGAAVAPTDATAVTALGRLLPQRGLSVLRTESLINDGTALVVYGLAVGVTAGQQHLTAGHVGWLFTRSYVGGIAAGAVVALFGAWLRRRILDPYPHNLVVILIPFGSYLLAEELGASGVLAVVAAGLIMTRLGPRIGTAATRLQTQGFWTLATFVLNASLFVLVGLQAQASVRGLASIDLARALGTIAAVCGVLIAVRFAFQFVTVYTIRALDRRPQQRLRRVGHRYRVISALAGFRGGVSLAAALAVPQTVHDGSPFPDRDVIVFVTFGVIVLGLVAQGLALPPVVRWANLPRDAILEDERRLAETVASESALAALPAAAARLGTDAKIVDRMRTEYEKRLRILAARDPDAENDEAALRYDEQYTALRLALLAHKRETVIRLRDEQRINDDVLRRLQERLDIEEVRMSGTVITE